VLLARVGDFAKDELKLPTGKIGEVVSTAHEWLHKAEHVAAAAVPNVPADKGGDAKGKATTATPPPVVETNPLATLQARMRQFAASQKGQQPRKK
jgi:hypothetical protein